MIPRSSTSASGRTKTMVLLVLVHLVCLGRITASSVNNGQDQLQQQTKKQEVDPKNSNNSTITESSNYKPDKAYRHTRALPRFENLEAVESSEEEGFLESVQKSPSETSSLYVIPHLRPGRKSSEILYSDESDQLQTIEDQENKRNSYTAIPMIRYGRSNSLIPIPRLGRSTEAYELSKPDLSSRNSLDPHDTDKEEIYEYDEIQQVKKDSMIPIPRYGRSESIIPMTRYGRSDSIIPMARYGRSASLIPMARYGRSDSLIPMARYGRSDSLIPMARYGRSDSLIPMARYGRSDSLIPMARYGRSDSLIPMARYGRSDSLIPMARYGRSDSLIPMARYGRSDSLIPMARYGRSDVLIPIPRFGKSVELSEDLDFDSDESRSEENSEEKYNIETLKFSKRKIDENGAVIPYPRPGRETDELKPAGLEVRRQTNESLIPQIRYGRSSGKSKMPENEQSHIFILPNIRPGRSSKNVISSKEKENSKSAQYGLLPYPRPGRSDINQNNMKKYYDYFYENMDSTNDKRSGESNVAQIVLESELEKEIFDPAYLKSVGEDNLINSDQDSSRFVIPYPRPGKRDLIEVDASADVLSGDVNRFPHLFKIIKEGNGNNGGISHHLNSQKENGALVPEELHGNDRQMENEEPMNYLSNPHSRFQKRSISSEKSKLLLPYPRLGRSSSLVPYPRLGRSNTILPFPRPGRSNSVLPYPRPGRSHSIVPYPRPGRSDMILPYPRPGRSTNVVPYPRPGRSYMILPYPRPGRSANVVPYPRPGRSNSVIPFPRPGRSDSIVPFPRPVLSNSIVPFPRPGRSDVILPYPRPGRSELILPYPRPGRSDTILPYPRLGRSTTVVPYPRPGRSTDGEVDSAFLETLFQEEGLRSDSSKLKDIPSLTKKLNKEISESNSIYILPYPRPGRAIKRNDA